MNKFLLGFLSLLVGLGLGFLIPHGATPVPNVGGLVHNTAEHYTSGVYVGSTDQFAVDASGNATTTNLSSATMTTATLGSSSSSPAVLGSAAAGHFIVAASQTNAFASTTAVTANSAISLTVEQTTPIAGTTCSSAVPTSTPVVAAKYPGNGFKVTLDTSFGAALCLSYKVTN